MCLILSENICPLISRDLIQRLNEIKVYSVIDLLSCDFSQLRRISRSKHIDFKLLLFIKKKLYLKYGPKRVSAFVCLKQRSKDSKAFKTGIIKLDKMLGKNRIKSGELTQLCGSSGSGKTQFCYTFMSYVMRMSSKPILYLDTNLAFSESRLEEILRNRWSVPSEEDIEIYLSKIKVFDVFDCNSLLDTIESISHELTTNSKSEFKGMALLIIDSLSTVLVHETKINNGIAESDEESNNQQNAINQRFETICKTTQIGNSLQNFAVKHSVAVVVVNSQSAAEKRNWKNFCKLCLYFERSPFDDEDSVQTSNPELNSVQTSNPELNSVQTSNPELNSVQTSNPELNSVQTSNPELNSVQTSNPELNSIQTSNPELNSVQTSNPELNSVQTSNPELNLVQTSSFESDSVQTSSAASDSVETTSSESNSVQTSNPESNSVQTSNPESNSVQIPSAESNLVQISDPEMKSTFTSIKITQSYDKRIENLSLDMFEICLKGILSPKQI